MRQALGQDLNERYRDAAALIAVLKAVKDDPDAIVDYMEPTVPLGGVREDTVPTTALTRSWANRLAKLYTQARRLHRDKEWQAVVDVFDQIHALDSEYPDAEGLLASAREALSAQEPTEQTLSWTNRLSDLYAQARQLLTGQPLSLEDRLAELYAQARQLHRDQFWHTVVNVFDQIHALDPAYPDPERLLVSAREELAALKLARIYDQGRRHMEAEEWQQALKSFEEVQRLKPGYRETERLLPQVREGLAAQETIITASNADRLQLLRTLEGHENGVSSVAFSPDGRLLASGSSDKTVRLWRVEDGELLHTLEGHENRVNSVAFSPDGRLLASGAGGKTVRLWRVEDGELLRTLEVYTDVAVDSVAFSPDGRLLALGSKGETVRLWRVAEDRTLLRTLGEQTPRVNSAAFSPDGLLLALGLEGRRVPLRQVEDGAFLRALDVGHTHQRRSDVAVISLAFSPDGRLLASSTADKMVQLSQVEDGTLLRTLRGQTDR